MGVFALRGPRWLVDAIDRAFAIQATNALRCSRIFNALRCSRIFKGSPDQMTALVSATWRVAALSTAVSALVFMVIPSQADALIAWASYFTCKGCIFGVSSNGIARLFARQQGTVEPACRLRWVAFGYASAAIEFLIIWVPQC